MFTCSEKTSQTLTLDNPASEFNAMWQRHSPLGSKRKCRGVICGASRWFRQQQHKILACHYFDAGNIDRSGFQATYQWIQWNTNSQRDICRTHVRFNGHRFPDESIASPSTPRLWAVSQLETSNIQRKTIEKSQVLSRWQKMMIKAWGLRKNNNDQWKLANQRANIKPEPKKKGASSSNLGGQRAHLARKIKPV